MIEELKTERGREMFFKKYRNLTTMEKSQLSEVSYVTMRTIMRQNGISRGECPFKDKEYKTKHKSNLRITDESIWNNRKWLYQKYVVEKLGMYAIGSIVGTDQKRIQYYLIKYSIPRRSLSDGQKSKNPCCNEEWIKDYYVRSGLSIRECAKLANCSTYTFYHWLVSFKIPIKGKVDKCGELSPSFGRRNINSKMA